MSCFVSFCLAFLFRLSYSVDNAVVVLRYGIIFCAQGGFYVRKGKYADLFTKRSDGLYMGYWRELDKNGERKGKRHAVYDRDPEKLYRKIQEKENATPPVLSFDDAAVAWEKKHTERIGAKTAETYTAPLRRILDKFSGYNAEDVSAQAIQAFLSDLGKQGFSRRTVQMHRDIMNMVFNNAIVEGWLSFNPVSAVSMPRNLPSKKRELPNDKAIEAVKENAGAPFGLFALICLYTGLRRGEVLALRYEDIDREHRVITVSRAIEYASNTPSIKSPKTEAGYRTVPLLDPLAAVLPASGSGLIFPREDGGPLTKIQYRKRWKKYCDHIGFEITAHQLRHGYATLLFEAGIPDKVAQALLGHASIAVTKDIYTHIRSTKIEEESAKLNSFVVKNVVK